MWNYIEFHGTSEPRMGPKTKIVQFCWQLAFTKPRARETQLWSALSLGFCFTVAPSTPKGVPDLFKWWECLLEPWHLSQANNELGIDLGSSVSWDIPDGKVLTPFETTLCPGAPFHHLHILWLEDIAQCVFGTLGPIRVRQKELVSGLLKDPNLEQSMV